MNKINILELSPIDLIKKRYNYDTKYQRDVAWAKKNWSLLIDSLMNDYFIPPILIANNEVIDGKQRILAIEKFINGEFKWKNVVDETSKEKYFSDFNDNEKAIFNLSTLKIFDLGKINEEKVIETFIRINNGSIKLNKAEMKLAEALPENRVFIKEITKNENIKLLTNGKKNDSRFKNEDLIIRCLSILFINQTNTKDVRNYSNRILKESLPEELEKLKIKVNETIDLMYSILKNTTIPIKSFNTIFEAIFIAFYKNLGHKKSLIENEEIIRFQIYTSIEEIIGGQMGGGIKFDSMDYISERIRKIEEIIKPFIKDLKRSYNYDDRIWAWNNLPHKCAECDLVFSNLNECQMDHIKPWIKGGKTERSNLQLLCPTCNIKKSDKFQKLN
ncbi:hypothetical protein CG007_01620 [Mesoplasma entomophilum]|uniref:HNH nuclease domain-containing protein n=1 Tax=Mesoplasma coleopterae TaxID=324078 RepID=A0A2K8P3X3_9MOLU|nr:MULTISPECIES: DUF262 domain-containing protein [Mesoplasma]ATZ20830.1 hypothetical protein MCOLE_v1c03160 [Mesoplasma coleopterae]AVN60314.1 hypothetical protein CG007_01620 [Mesoplasma entomophilum]